MALVWRNCNYKADVRLHEHVQHLIALWVNVLQSQGKSQRCFLPELEIEAVAFIAGWKAKPVVKLGL